MQESLREPPQPTLDPYQSTDPDKEMLVRTFLRDQIYSL
jgi:hypothetical protein